MTLIVPYILASIFFVIANISSYTISKNIKRLFSVYCVLFFFIFLFFFIGGKPVNAGNDTILYLSSYGNLDSYYNAFFKSDNYYGGGEYLFWTLAYFFKSFGLDFSSYFHAYVLFFAILYFLWLKRVAENDEAVLCISITFFLLCYFLLFLSNAMRQVSATPFVLFAILYYGNRNYFLYLLFSFIAIGLHLSSIILFLYPLFYLLSIKVKKRTLFYTVLFLFVFSFFTEVVVSLLTKIDLLGLSNKVSLYSEEQGVFNVLVYKTFNFWLVTFIYVCSYFSKYFSKELFKQLSFFMSFVYLTSQYPEVGQRFMITPYLYVPIYIAYTLVNVSNLGFISKHKELIYIVFITICLLYGYLTYTNDSFIYNLVGE